MPQLHAILHSALKHWWFVLLLAVVVALRIPNFSEPYWYGDEAIYLTVGNGLKDGQILYKEIVDHKTPLIYYFAMVPNQWWFRVLMLGWMLATTAVFYEFSTKLLKQPWESKLASILFVLLTTLPWFEGHIPNGELFVLGFVLTGFYLLSRTSLLPRLTAKPADFVEIPKPLLLIAAGIFFGLGALTKVPGLFDFIAAVFLVWIVSIKEIAAKQQTRNTIVTAIKQLASTGLWLFAGWITALLLSAAYFAAIGAGADYLQYGLLYNFHYSGTWQHTFSFAWLGRLFSLPGKFAITAILMLLLSIPKVPVKPAFRFVAGWFALSLFAVLLSNRPYPHYLLQLVPSFVLVTVVTFAELLSLRAQILKKNVSLATPTYTLAISSLLIGLTIAVLLLLDFHPYSVSEYYGKYAQLKSGKLDKTAYDYSFHWLIADNTKATSIIHSLGEKSLFVWGTNPMLYAQSGTYPVGRFTVSFHIIDLQAYAETMEHLRAEQPKLIVVMHDESHEFPEFFEFLHQNYVPNYELEHMTLYLRLPRAVVK